jgi:hypothetical protein
MLQIYACIFPENWFLLRGKTAKRKAEESLLQPKNKVCACYKETYFFFAVFFVAFFAGAFFAAIICSPPFFQFTALKIILLKNQHILFIYDRFHFVNRNITFWNN